MSEFADIRVGVDNIIAYVETGSSGMGIETSFAQVLADMLSVDLDQIQIVQGDTDKVARGFGSHGSRSMRIGGNAIREAANVLNTRAKQLAGEMLQCTPEEVELHEGVFQTATTEHQLNLFDVARHAIESSEELSASFDYVAELPTYPNSCHVCEVEVDPDTGVVSVLRLVMVKDVGRAINPRRHCARRGASVA